MNRLVLTLALKFVVALATPSVVVQHLYGGPRLNDPSYIDYYFCCNVEEDTTLQWRVNRTFIGGFREGDAGRVLANAQPGFSYSAILLSSNASSLQGKFSFDSVLTVSFNSYVSLEVVCFSGQESSTANNIDPRRQVEVIRNNDAIEIVALQYLFEADIIKTANQPRTYAFLCGVNFKVQSWIFEGLPFGFSIRDSFSQRSSILSADRNTANPAATFIAREPYNIISILFVTIDNATESLDMNVTCTAGNYQAQIPILFVHSSPEDPATATANAMLTTRTSEVSSVAATNAATDLNLSDSPFPMGSSGLEAYVIGIAVVLSTVAVALVLLTLAVALYCFRKRHKIDEDSKKPEEDNENHENRYNKMIIVDVEYSPNTHLQTTTLAYIRKVDEDNKEPEEANETSHESRSNEKIILDVEHPPNTPLQRTTLAYIRKVDEDNKEPDEAKESSHENGVKIILDVEHPPNTPLQTTTLAYIRKVRRKVDEDSKEPEEAKESSHES